MKTILRNASDAEIFGRLLKTAQHGTFDGLTTADGSLHPYLDTCRWWLERYGCIVILTRDVGYHTSGWWKNPDYERCYHMSISFPGGFQRKVVEHLLKGLFGDSRRWIWCEGPYSIVGQQCGVYHYRLFCDAAWQPIKPRGEVYSKQFTERGWKSFSEIHNF